MPMGMKMAIATKTAKRVTEETKYYTLVHKSTNKVLSTHKDLDSAKDEHRGMDQGERAHYRIATSTKEPKTFNMKEEDQQIDELKTGTLIRYSTKANQALVGGDRNKEDRRIQFINRAIQKIKTRHSKPVGDIQVDVKKKYNKEEIEQVDEVSKKTAVSYIQKKISQIAKRPGEAMLYTTKMNDKDYSNLKRAYKRAGVKEEVELDETKSAPKGFHFTKDGKLKRGDADQDGPGGPKLRSDPLDKTRSKVPPVSEEHYCAKHVYSELFGEGQVIEGDHAEPNDEGQVEWYNVQFEHGIEKVFTEDIEIMMAEYHANHKRKKRMTNGR